MRQPLVAAQPCKIFALDNISRSLGTINNTTLEKKKYLADVVKASLCGPFFSGQKQLKLKFQSFLN